MRAELIDRIPWACPQCRSSGPYDDQTGALRLESVLHEADGHLMEGFLACVEPRCGARYPVIEGLPIVLKDPAGWWQHQNQTDGLGQRCATAQMADFCNGMQKQSSQALEHDWIKSVYLDAHYMDPVQDDGGEGSGTSGNTMFWQTARRLAAGMDATHGQIALDMGCGAGRYTFELARQRKLVVGLDLNFDLLSCALEIQQKGHVDYQRRIHGRRFQAAQARFEGPDNVVFMVADAMDPPFAAQAFDLVAGLNIIDNVSVPLTFLGQVDALLRPGGRLVLGSPYEWNTANTDFGEWLESPGMDSAEMVAKILKGDLFPQTEMAYTILEEHQAIPWSLRQHDRLTSLYRVHMLAAEKIKPV